MVSMPDDMADRTPYENILYEKDSGEIIREIPPKELQLLHSKIQAWVGVVMDRYS